MEFKKKLEKINKLLSFTNKNNFIEQLNNLEYNFNFEDNSNLAYIPLEANFQLPNTFLKSAISNSVKHLFESENSFQTNWNKQIDMAIEYFDFIEFDTEITDENEDENNSQMLKDLINERFNIKNIN